MITMPGHIFVILVMMITISLTCFIALSDRQRTSKNPYPRMMVSIAYLTSQLPLFAVLTMWWFVKCY